MNNTYDEHLLEEADNEYVIITKDMTNIIKDMNVSDDEGILCKSIISNLESEVSNTIKNGLIANIPNIGCVRKSPVQKAMVKHYAEFHIARKNMDKEEYRDYVRSVISDEKRKDAIKQHNKRIVKKLKSSNKSKYETLVKHLGFAYANMWIKAIILLDEVPFSQEVQDAYDNINKQ